MENLLICKRKASFFATVIVASILVGCAGTGTPPDGQVASDDQKALTTAELTGDFSRSKLIAADFVATMKQLPESQPSETVLHTNKPSTRFGELLLSSLQSAGFDLRIGNAQSQRWLAYNANRDSMLSDAGNPVYTFIVAAGDIKLKRSYEVDQYGVMPAGSMFVRGASAETVVMDDSIFSVRRSETAGAVTDQQSTPNSDIDAAIVELQAIPSRKPLTTIRKQAVASPRAVVQRKAPQRADIQPSTSGSGNYEEFSNMFVTDKSRYEEIFKSYGLVESVVYIFPNDSLMLGKQNKILVQQLTKNFNSSTDVLSVIGCSHGSSNIENGNAYLANSRAFRVKEEFVSAGLSDDKVFEEGCWAGVAHPKMPARGVLVEHKRLN